MKSIDKEILRLSLPSILANMTVPLVGIVDTAVAGHLAPSDGGSAAVFIGAISVGSMIFNLLYWNCSFLRTGTGGITAQAFGRSDMHECASIFARSIATSFVLALFILALQLPFLKLSLAVTDGSADVESYAAQYFLIRIWAAPATLGLMAFTGWFVGMQDSLSSMWKDLTVNLVNIVASLILSFGIGDFKGFGFAGVALGTVVAQYSGLLYCIIRCFVKYRNVLSLFKFNEISGLFGAGKLRSLFKMNADLVLRSLSFTFIYLGYTVIATGISDLMLACSSIMMQLLMIFSYFTDGFAYAGEAMSGKYIGASDLSGLRATIKHVFVWSMSIAVLFIGIYMVTGAPLLRLMTNDRDVTEACMAFLPWLAAMPPLGCAAFTWDGIYLGATATPAIRNSMLGSAVCFLLVWGIGVAIWHPEGSAAMHLLMAAYFAHLAFRTVVMTAKYRKSVISKLQQNHSYEKK